MRGRRTIDLTTVDAFIHHKRYRGVANGIYLKKISACATKLRDDPDSMQILRDMVK